MSDKGTSPNTPSPAGTANGARKVLRTLGWIVGLPLALLLTGTLLLGIALAMAYPNLPEIHSLVYYRPKLPMRVVSSDGVMLG